MNKAFAIFARAVQNCIWAIEPAALAALMAKAETVNGEEAAAKLITEANELLNARAIHGTTVKAVAAKQGSAAIVPVVGILSPTRSSFWDEIFGTPKTNPLAVADMVDAAVADPDVKVVVLVVDCPGGNAILVPEAAARIMAARGKKPIIAVITGNCASGGYWIAAAADEIVCSQASMVGSIGCFIGWTGYFDLNEQNGIIEEYIASVPDKVEGMGHIPLTDEARAHKLTQAQQIDKMFIRDINAGRGQDMDQEGRGRTYIGESAVARGLVDKVDTLAGVLGRFNAPVADPQARRGSNESRARHMAMADANLAVVERSIDLAAKR